MTQTGREIIIRRTRDVRRAEEWALVLEAEGLEPRLVHNPEGWILAVPSQHLEQAVTELWAYESEGRNTAPEEPSWPGRAPFYTSAGGALALVAFIFVSLWTQGTVRWIERGSASAELILRGEWWRTVTALTLHGDLVHVGTNAIAMVFFLTAVCRTLGPGLGVAMALVAGTLGNLCNAWFYGFDHISVGASTAVFGALGLLGGAGVARRRRLGLQGRRAWIPLVAGLAILAMLGTGGHRVDFWAHFWGFICGGVLGACVVPTGDQGVSNQTQVRFGVVAGVVLVTCWAVALS